jgi:hypothetical protein
VIAQQKEGMDRYRLAFRFLNSVQEKYVQLHLWFQKTGKSGLLKMMIAHERFTNAQFLHQNKRSAIDQRPSFVRATFTEIPSSQIYFSVNMNDLNVGRYFDCIDYLKDLWARATKRTMKESNQLGDDVDAGD